MDLTVKIILDLKNYKQLYASEFENLDEHILSKM